MAPLYQSRWAEIGTQLAAFDAGQVQRGVPEDSRNPDNGGPMVSRRGVVTYIVGVGVDVAVRAAVLEIRVTSDTVSVGTSHDCQNNSRPSLVGCHWSHKHLSFMLTADQPCPRSCNTGSRQARTSEESSFTLGLASTRQEPGRK